MREERGKRGEGGGRDKPVARVLERFSIFCRLPLSTLVRSP